MQKIGTFAKKALTKIIILSGLYVPLRKLADIYEQRTNKPVKKIPPADIGWSIIVITASKKVSVLDELVVSAARELQGSPYEIVIVGPASLDLSTFKDIPIIHVTYHELGLWGVPGLISKKKNIGATYAHYDKLAVCHDYIVFEPGWKKGWETFGDFVACATIMLNKDGSRHRDWITWDYPEIGQALVPYEYNLGQYQYLNGAYFIIKRDFFLGNPIDEKLRWGEGEDVEWSLRIRRKTQLMLNKDSIISYNKQKPSISDRWINNTKKLEQILRQKNNHNE
jgi:hypothetical protein